MRLKVGREYVLIVAVKVFVVRELIGVQIGKRELWKIWKCGRVWKSACLLDVR